MSPLSLTPLLLSFSPLPTLFVLLVLVPQRAKLWINERTSISISPQPLARAKISGQLTCRRPCVLVPISLQINDQPTLSLSRPIYQNQQLGQMMIKHPDRQGPPGPRSQHYRRLQLDLIALPSHGCERKKRQFHWQVLLACKATRAKEPGMSHFPRLCVREEDLQGLVHFIKIHSFRPTGHSPELLQCGSFVSKP